MARAVATGTVYSEAYLERGDIVKAKRTSSCSVGELPLSEIAAGLNEIRSYTM